ncbi:MAG: hypothetical protein AAF791_11805 [Bacteroidota bacterium]
MPNVSLSSPATPVLQPQESLDGLSAADLKSRLDARQRDLTFRVRALGQELGLVADDVVVEERPFIDRVQQRPLVAVGLALATGALLGLTWGLRARAKKRPGADLAGDVLRFHTAKVMELAARRVARGADVTAAIEEEVRRQPVVLVPPDEAIAEAQAASTTRQMVDTALKTAIGIGVKTGMDQLTKRLTGHEETFEALQDAAD